AQEAGPLPDPSQQTASDRAVPHLSVGPVHLPVTMLYVAPLLWSPAEPGQFPLFYPLQAGAVRRVESGLPGGRAGSSAARAPNCWRGLLTASLRWLRLRQTPRLARIQGWGTARTCLARSSPHREPGDFGAVPRCGGGRPGMP